MLLSPATRTSWHVKALSRFYDCDIVFLDPDNGMLVKSVGQSAPKSIKYVLPEEIIEYYASGKSVVFYNHRSREKESVYLKRFDWLQTEKRLSGASVFGLKFVCGTIRDYIFLAKPEHSSRVSYAIENILNSPRKQHYSKLDFGV